jgi:hypothetical protein
MARTYLVFGDIEGKLDMLLRSRYSRILFCSSPMCERARFSLTRE